MASLKEKRKESWCGDNTIYSYKEEDVREAINDFEKYFADWLVDIQHTDEFTPLQVIGKFQELKKEIFGDWEK